MSCAYVERFNLDLTRRSEVAWNGRWHASDGDKFSPGALLTWWSYQDDKERAMGLILARETISGQNIITIMWLGEPWDKSR